MVHKLLSNLLKRYSGQSASIEALSAFFDLPIAFLLITNFEQPVLGIVAFAALRTNDISAQAGALAVVICCNSEAGPATARDQEHLEPFSRRERSEVPSETSFVSMRRKSGSLVAKSRAQSRDSQPGGLVFRGPRHRHILLQRPQPAKSEFSRRIYHASTDHGQQHFRFPDFRRIDLEQVL